MRYLYRIFLLVTLLVLASCATAPSPQVVLYCAQDQEFAESILKEFHQRTGLEVSPKYDTEATKSVSLAVELMQEKNRPRCDMHWNNEIVSTIRLQRQGLLESYDSPSAKPFPPSAKAKDHTWHAFAARARVLLVNKNLVKDKDRPTSLLDLARPRWKGLAAMAKPQFGTTATQAAALFEVLGTEAARKYYQGLKDNGVHIVAGNKDVARGVAEGQFAVGVTDTDDAIIEVDAGRPVALVFPDRDGGKRIGTLFIPNTVAVVKGCPHPEGARKLVDFLLSAEVEGKLAEAESHQIPLNPEVRAKLPAGIETPQQVRAMKVDWEKAADVWEETQAFMNQLFGRAE